MNTKSADDDIEDGDDEDDCNGDVVEDGGGLVVLCVVYVQTSQHQKEDARQNLEKGNLQHKEFQKRRVLIEDLEDNTGDDEGEKNSVELVLLANLT